MKITELFLSMTTLLLVLSSQTHASNEKLSFLSLPPGFRISLWADVPGARSLAVSEDGKSVYVGTRGESVYHVQDENGDFQADSVSLFADGLKVPNGIALNEAGDLYIAEQHQIALYGTDGRRKKIVVRPGLLPDLRHHGWRFMDIGPKGDLYVAVGAPCNICEISGVEGTILRFDAKTFKPVIQAKGVRNSVGFDWHPDTGILYFTDNGGDNLGDLIPPDELNISTRAGQHFGYPYEYDAGQPYPQFKDVRSSEAFIPPTLRFEAHAAALGIHFYRGQQFPEGYRKQALVAQHGSWNRTDPIGYRIMLVTFDEAGKPVRNQVFIDGWLRADGEVRGRPVDIAELPDGSLLISDDNADAIYRVSFSPKSR